jgi:hypothetical protein
MRLAPQLGRSLQVREDLQAQQDLQAQEAQEDRLHLFRLEGQVGRCRPWDQVFRRNPLRQPLT